MEKEKALNKEIETMKRMATKRKDNTKFGDEWKSSEEPVSKRRKQEEVTRSKHSVLDIDRENMSDIRTLFEELTQRKEHPVGRGE